jgi:hypothetical protein
VNNPGVIEKLRKDHDVNGFDCGKENLNRFLHRYAWINQQAYAAQTYVLTKDNKVFGYYSLATGSVTHASATQRVTAGQACHPISVILLARLAVDKTCFKKGICAALLKDALVGVSSAAEIVGARTLLVHAKDTEAKSFYEHFNFKPSPSDSLHLFLLMKSIRAVVRSV